MISYEEARISRIISQDEEVSWVELECLNTVKKAVNYNKLTGGVEVGDRVVINTTAVTLGLGTGGQHFIIYNHERPSQELGGSGHIMKLRYTPMQMKVRAAEEEAGDFHQEVKNFKSLEGHPVIVASLHSMLAPTVAMLKYLNKDLRINYIMTDAGALPLAFSKTVKDLKSKGLINSTISVGHAFGGDYETVNIYTGLIVSKDALKADISIITMGPGIVGTGTKYGFSGVEQGVNLDAVNSLGGRALVVPRIGFKDERSRHRGLSHQTITSLVDIAKTRGEVIFPLMEAGEKLDLLKKQIKDSKLEENHTIVYEDGSDIEKALAAYNLNTKTMGRGIEEEAEFFHTLGATARYATKIL